VDRGPSLYEVRNVLLSMFLHANKSTKCIQFLNKTITTVLYDLVLEITTPLIVYISRRHGGTCKFGFVLTCGMLITSPEFTSNLTGKTYYTKLFDPPILLYSAP
jgi:hypothetical protein